MTREEAIKHGQEQLEVFGGEHRKFIELAIKALGQTTHCDLCRYNPPSSGDGKPCSMCPACSGGDEE